MPSVPPSARRIYQFGVFELDVYTRELRRSGVRLNVQDQPLQLLRLLLERPGELVTREELRQELWPSDTFVGFEHGLNAAVRRLRETLGDSADTPRFIETLPRRGYRFIGAIAGDPAAVGREGRDVAADLRSLTDIGDLASSAGRRPPSWRRTATRVVLPSAVIAGVIGGLAVRVMRPSSPAPIVRTQLDVHPAHDVYSVGLWNLAVYTPGGSRTALVWTPNGRTLVFVGQRNGIPQIYLRDLARPEARVLAGTEGAHMPAVSPDGQWVAFWAKGEIRRVPLAGGPAQTLVTGVPDPPFGLTVGVTGRVAFAKELGGIWQVASGSAPSAVTSLAKGELQHALPQFVANDGVLVFTVRSSAFTWGTERVMAQVLTTGQRKLLVQDAADARYLPSGHLLFLRRGLLMVVPFDLARLAVTGPPVGVLDGVAQALTSDNSGDITGAGQFSVSAAGNLAYISSPAATYPDTVLVSLDRQGRVSVLSTETRLYMGGGRLSPDGRRLAVSIRTLTEVAVWILDLTRGSLTKLTAGGEAMLAEWTPDGRHIAFTWFKDGAGRVAWQRVDGSAPPETLVPESFVPASWSPDGQQLALLKDGDIWVVTVGNGQPTLTRVTATAEEERSPEFSPDGRWLAYASNKTGRYEVYLRPVSAVAPVTLVSSAGGSSPSWNPRGGELFFVAPKRAAGKEMTVPTIREGQFMAVAVRDGNVGPAVRLFDTQPNLGFDCMPSRCYDVTPDGLQLVATKFLPRNPPPPPTHINLVLNWVEELKAKVPVN